MNANSAGAARKPVALITGGSRGIGHGCALELARQGYDLAIAGRRPADDCADALQALRDAGAAVEYAVCDVAAREAREALLARVREAFGRLQVLVNNAGVAPRERRDLLEATEESFDEVIAANLRGPYFLTQAVARWMIGQKRADAGFRGCIINISSVSATMPSVNRGEYCLSKAGVAMATRLWAARLAEFGIPVYEVRPGIVATDMTAGVQAKYDRFIAEGGVPLGRWGLPEDVGKAVAALAGGAFPYTTGQAFLVDGGITLQRF